MSKKLLFSSALGMIFSLTSMAAHTGSAKFIQNDEQSGLKSILVVHNPVANLLLESHYFSCNERLYPNGTGNTCTIDIKPLTRQPEDDSFLADSSSPKWVECQTCQVTDLPGEATYDRESIFNDLGEVAWTEHRLKITGRTAEDLFMYYARNGSQCRKDIFGSLWQPGWGIDCVDPADRKGIYCLIRGQNIY